MFIFIKCYCTIIVVYTLSKINRRLEMFDLNLKEDDIYIASPNKIGIIGNNLYDDIIRASESLNINNFLNIEELLEEQKILRK